MGFELKRLEWDSAFFGFGVMELTGYGNAASFTDEIAKAAEREIKLIYWKIREPKLITFSPPEHLKIFDAGKNILFEKKAAHIPDEISPVIKPFRGEVTKELLQLAHLAGAYSRFKTDPLMPAGSFNRLYEAWIENSIRGNMADFVFVAEAEGFPMGLITVKKQNEKAVIGLFSVHEQFRQKGLGKQLLEAAEFFALKNNCIILQVTTQENAPAAAVYLKNNFEERGRESIFHIWL